jgi:3-oxoacyl-[acyl-carrier protein] reductase
VTGSSRGIGKAVALRLAADGFAVTINYAGNRAGAEEVVGQITAAGGRAAAVGADVARLAEVERLFRESEQAWGRIDVLVNCAGVMFTKPVADVGEEEFDRLIAVNLKGTFFCCREAARRMAEGGRIVNLSSSTTALMLPGYAAYVASKGAVEQLTHVLAKELGSRRITVNAVSPGPTDTELFNQGKSEEQKQFYARMAALGRLGTPEDIACAVAMLVGPDGAWITGQNLRANGGLI